MASYALIRCVFIGKPVYGAGRGIRGGDGGRGLWTPKIDTVTQLFL